jgi:trimeric autotransporter adhesin
VQVLSREASAEVGREIPHQLLEHLVAVGCPLLPALFELDEAPILTCGVRVSFRSSPNPDLRANPATHPQMDARENARFGDHCAHFGRNVVGDRSEMDIHRRVLTPMKILALVSSVFLQLALVASALFASATAQCVDWTPGYHLRGVDGNVYASAVFDDGSGHGPELYVGGDFQAAGDVAARHIARWNGTRWAAVGDGIEGAVYSLLVWNDGSGEKLWAGSYLLPTHSVSNVLASWNGSTWTPAASGAMAYGPLYALASYDDGSGPALYIGTRITTITGVTLPNEQALARYDGATWSMVGGGLTSNGFYVTAVQALHVYDDGSGPRLFAGGGGLRTVLTGASGPVWSWDGSTWSASSAGYYVSGQASTFAERSTASGPNELYACGYQTINASTTTLMRWNGASWLSVSPSNLGPVTELFGRPQPGVESKVDISVGGAAFGPFPSRTVATWDGAQYAILGANPPSTTVNTFALYDEGAGEQVFVGGAANISGAPDTRGVLRLDASTWTAVGAGSALSAAFTPAALVVHDDGSGRALYGVGSFDAGGSIQLCRWTGQSWAPLGAAFNASVRALVVFDDGIHGAQIHAGGAFTSIGGASMNRLARWDGTSWQPLGAGVALVNTVPAEVRALGVFDLGSGPRLVIGGKFDLAGGAPANRVATWDGTSYATLGSGMNNHVDALCVYDDGTGAKLYAGGEFDTAGGVAAPVIARWDGAAWAGIGAHPNQYVTGLRVHDDGSGRKLYVTGNFTAIGSLPAQNIARFDGTNWEALTGNLSAIQALATFDDGEGGGPQLYAAAQLYVGGAWRRGLHRWDGTAWSALSLNLDDAPTALAVLDDNTGNGAALFAGGPFATAGTHASTRIARYGRTGAAGCTGSTGTAFCLGDGSGSACPCANTGASGRGCDNSAASGGARLVAEGQSLLAADSVTLQVSGTTPFGAMLFFQGTARASGGNGAPFGDGLRCVGGQQLRLAIRTASFGQAAFGHAIPGDARVSQAGFLPQEWSTRHYQVWYRDAQNFCTSSTFNLSNGLTLRWAP